MKKYRKINPCLHGLLEEMSPSSFNRISKDLLLFHQDSRNITKVLFDHLDAWHQTARVNKKEKYLLSKKSRNYIVKFLKQYYSEEENSFQEIDSKRKLGIILALQFCVNTIITINTARKTFRDLLDRYKVHYPHHASDISTWTNWEVDHNNGEVMKTAEELIILLAAR